MRTWLDGHDVSSGSSSEMERDEWISALFWRLHLEHLLTREMLGLRKGHKKVFPVILA